MATTNCGDLRLQNSVCDIQENDYVICEQTLTSVTKNAINSFTPRFNIGVEFRGICLFLGQIFFCPWVQKFYLER